ncbi:MAG: TetR/AcrR family transcriptional regulator [Ignavibacteria bacterium]|nr:TetR/AcrR family transcriptional regulator [Ignavibacteria bacterium]MBT8382791.1 TetR/AcrR family transcriptional regulator [Ignavibacteria bacterium]MBT8392678.1 TetR/AcrR family transcriptional regulator [Ignavibacteria bacterium]NNJ52542.1 TetR/AcrR family transcriptional regulator [Ignavibacteriaceae bacterium]NNL21987.1 TetR/AcrR family transcriptional regulator [Ignavibacteriaceae bacterium]
MPRTKKQFEEIRKSSKEKILNVALELFVKKGYHATSISQIAQKAKISKGLMYNYFASKEDLLDEIILQGFHSLEELEFRTKRGVHPQTQLEDFVDAVLDNLYSNFNYWQLYLALLVHPEIQKKYEKKMKQFRDEFIQTLTLLFKKLKIKNPKLEAFLLGTFFDGLVLNFIAAEDVFPISKIKNAILSKYIKSNKVQTRKTKK